jgi:hypothetical protein
MDRIRTRFIEIYKKYPIFVNIIKNTDDNYIEFLYLHTSENIHISFIKPDKYIKNVNIIPKNNYCESLLLIYNSHFTMNEKDILTKNKPFNIYFYESEYPKQNTDDYFKLKNRRDFLIPCFLNKNTIHFLELVKINDIEVYKNHNKLFFTTLAQIRKYVKTKERLGVMVDGSATLSIHNVRKMKDLDLVIFHPRYYENKIKRNLLTISKELKFIDPYFYNFKSWHGEDKNVLDKQISHITDNKYTDFMYAVFDPQFTYYFYGIKIISLDYNLKYRAMRNYPKNIADIIITKYKLNIDVPPIQKIANIVNSYNEKTYTKDEFIDMINKYLIKFNFRHKDFDIVSELNNLAK